MKSHPPLTAARFVDILCVGAQGYLANGAVLDAPAFAATQARDVKRSGCSTSSSSFERSTETRVLVGIPRADLCPEEDLQEFPEPIFALKKPSGDSPSRSSP